MIVIAGPVGSQPVSHVIIVIGILEWTSTARIIRAQVMSVRERAYVKRARGMGAGNFRIVWRHNPAAGRPAADRQHRAHHPPSRSTWRPRSPSSDLEDPTAVTWGTILEHALRAEPRSPSGAWWAIVPGRVSRSPPSSWAASCSAQAVEDALNPPAQGRTPVVAPVAGSGRWWAGGRTPYEPARGVRPCTSGSRRRTPRRCTRCRGVSFAPRPRGEAVSAWSASQAAGGRPLPSSRSWGCCRRTRSVAGEGPVGRPETSWRAERTRCRPYRWKDVAMVFQGRDERPEPGEEGRLADRRADGPSTASRRARRRPQGGPGNCWRWWASPAAAGDRYPPRVLRRHAAASLDRDGARLRA